MSTTHSILYNSLDANAAIAEIQLTLLPPTHHRHHQFDWSVCVRVCHECVACTIRNSWNINCVFNRNNKSISITCEQNVFANGEWVCEFVYALGGSCVYELWPRCQQNEQREKRNKWQKQMKLFVEASKTVIIYPKTRWLNGVGIIVDGFCTLHSISSKTPTLFARFNESLSIFSIRMNKHGAGRWLRNLDKSLNMTM